jgi:uncharacterized protein
MSKFPSKTWMSPKIEVRESKVGKGMFAKEPIKQGETVVIWGGDYTGTQGALKAKELGKITMQWGTDIWTVEDAGEDETYFINHSCDPNLWMEGISTLVARKSIAKDEELTADYAMWEADENHTPAWECRCGSTLCRKRITGKDYLLSELQNKYRDHFSELINNRIKLKQVYP